MPAVLSSLTRRGVLVGVAATSAASLLSIKVQAAGEGPAIRPFSVNFPEEELVDLRRRIAATRWPERETVTDAIAGRATRDDAGTRALLGDGVRLAEDRGAD